MARVCAEPRCPVIAIDGTHCEQHRRDSRSRQERSPASAWAKRQYKTKRWRCMRIAQLAKQPYCQCDHHKGQKVRADDERFGGAVVDHEEPHRGDPRKFWHGKLQSLTKHCHDSWKQHIEKAAAQRGGGTPAGGLESRKGVALGARKFLRTGPKTLYA